jgi:hypothetical protein
VSVADSSLGSSLSTEIVNRVSGDSSLGSSLSTANVNRLSADTSLGSSLSTEISYRVTGDTNLGSSLTTEISVRQQNVLTLSTALYNDSNSRINGDTSLKSEINTINTQVSTINYASGNYISVLMHSPNNSQSNSGGYIQGETVTNFGTSNSIVERYVGNITFNPTTMRVVFTKEGYYFMSIKLNIQCSGTPIFAIRGPGTTENALFSPPNGNFSGTMEYNTIIYITGSQSVWVERANSNTGSFIFLATTIARPNLQYDVFRIF